MTNYKSNLGISMGPQFPDDITAQTVIETNTQVYYIADSFKELGMYSCLYN